MDGNGPIPTPAHGPTVTSDSVALEQPFNISLHKRIQDHHFPFSGIIDFWGREYWHDKLVSKVQGQNRQHLYKMLHLPLTIRDNHLLHIVFIILHTADNDVGFKYIGWKSFAQVYGVMSQTDHNNVHIYNSNAY